jgi:hypothetical protein
MTRHATRLLLASLGAILLAAPTIARQPPRTAPPTGFADAVLGRWDLTVEGANGVPFPSWVHVHLRKESELQGRFVGQFGSVRNLTKVEYWDGALVFEVPVQYEQNKTDLRFEGKLTGDRLEGTTHDAKGATLKWTGRRAPESGSSREVTFGEPVELFNGRDLTGWKPRSTEHPGCWQVIDGALTAAAKCVDLISERTFGDARLHVEFKYPPKGNAGLYLRGRYEVQIQDDRGKALDALRMGGVYGFIRPSVDAAGAPDEWQTYDITLRGRRVTIALNGKTIADNEVIPGITGGALDSNEGEPGPLMLQGDHGKIAFRKITLTPAR